MKQKPGGTKVYMGPEYLKMGSVKFVEDSLCGMFPIKCSYARF